MCVYHYGTITNQRDPIVNYQRTTPSRSESLSPAATNDNSFRRRHTSKQPSNGRLKPKRSVLRTQEENHQPNANQL